MFKTKCKKTVSKMILSFILITVTLLSGCQKNSTHSAIEFGTIDVSEIDKIELSGTTGGKDGNFSYTLSDQEKKEFVHLLNQVELGDEVDKNQALLSGAVTYYKLYFQGKDVVTLCPGHYFGVDEKYYEFVNFDKLWDEFVTFNSKQDTSEKLQEKEQVYFDATVLEVKKKSIKVKCSESFDSGIPVDEEFSVTTNIVESGELPDLNAGDHIRIVFDGIIKESYPLQLGNVFAIYLLDENGNL
ncbi:hypothetical protein LIP65_00530 [Mediterraneibacter faecis]|jgi:hypothetical protein|uniref:hypothetical protein n=1 Tax=Mediterraneibacter faecis TaxID=592978 RepID=UPI00033A9443|nr:hypothetical protein [Mediterraneibacter faecis]CDC14955.1 putative uncharacterized protein [Ruminococcus sp. CAG:55]MCB5560825.1 hypothetical protein [Mediterraneibacter faecis]MCB5566779.1 hypothetical protein [Mediterraneibacter faecis]MCB5578597.1 hypothetical protein [Mediterraneibacter faecis]MCB5585693.1 hypothetical protein [Mediterraneibacter faecis]